jgi:hypothetical protein
MIDILDYMLPDEAWALENHLAVAGGGQPLYTAVVGKMIWEMKGSAGFPWDGNLFDENYVYQSITEQSWTSPTTFKMFASGSWKGANGGIVWAPRYFNPGTITPPAVTPDSTYRIYTACGVFTSANLGGPIETHIEGPYEINFGGSLGLQTALVQTYKWGANFANLEVNYYVPGFGHVQWESWTLVNGLYVQKQVSAFNTKLAGGTPALSFPCGVPVL